MWYEIWTKTRTFQLLVACYYFFFVHQNDTTKTDVCSIHTFKDNKWILEHITNQQPLNTVSTLNRKQLFIYLKWKWKFLLRRFQKPQAFSLHIYTFCLCAYSYIAYGFECYLMLNYEAWMNLKLFFFFTLLFLQLWRWRILDLGYMVFPAVDKCTSRVNHYMQTIFEWCSFSYGEFLRSKILLYTIGTIDIIISP